MKKELKINVIERKSNKESILSYVYTMIFTFCVLLSVLFALEIYPFGDNAYLWADADQYFGIEHYFGTVSGANDIFYSWGNVLSGNALSQLAYYSFSPFNIIFILFNDNMIFAAHAVAYLKIVLTSLSFCFFLNYFYKDKHYIVKSLLATCYAFMGYMVFYGWNISWMDGVMALPFITVGIYRIIKGKNIFLYVFSLSFALISNFYIGWMLCITSFIFYVAANLLLNERAWTGIKNTLARYIFASLISAGFSAFLLIPTYMSLPVGRKLSLSEMLSGMNLTDKPANVLSGVFTGQINTLGTNSPLIYVGTLALILDIFFFLNKEISKKKKWATAGVIFIFVFSFLNGFINKIWHGFSNNSCFNYRYSFVLSFVFLVIAYESYVSICKGALHKSEYIAAGSIFLASAFYVMQETDGKIRMWGISIDLVCAIVIFAFLIRYHEKRFGKLVLSLCILFSLAGNSYLYLKNYEMQSITTYARNKAIMDDAFETIDDTSFYRMDKSFLQGRCDGNLFNYRGVTNYASTENLQNEDFLKKLGVQHSWMYAQYNTNMPIASESLLGLKYILTDTINGKGYEKLGGVLRRYSMLQRSICLTDIICERFY